MRRRLHILGRPIDVELELRDADPTLLSLWEPARAASEAISEIVRKAEALRGVTATCRDGCAACCRHLVPISTIEAVRLARVVDALPAGERAAVRARFEGAVRRLERAGMLDARARRGRTAMTTVVEEGESAWDTLSRRYRAMAIACPFLVRERCSIYEDRPLVCREYLVSSPPNACAAPDGDVAPLPRPVRMGEALAGAATSVTGDDQVGSIPLVLALEWSAAHGEALEGRADGDALVAALAEAMVVDDG